MRAGVPVVPGTDEPLGADVPDDEIARVAAGDRLSADGQGGRRRRRQGHADGDRAGRPAGARARGAVGSGLGVRRRGRLPRAAARCGRATSRSSCSAITTARCCRSSSASARSSGAIRRSSRRRRRWRSRRRCGARMTVGGRGRRASGRLHQRRHDRVPARRGRPVLLPRDEHAAAGRASDHRDGDRRRPGALADSHRPRRAARPRSGSGC